MAFYVARQVAGAVVIDVTMVLLLLLVPLYFVWRARRSGRMRCCDSLAAQLRPRPTTNPILFEGSPVEVAAHSQLKHHRGQGAAAEPRTQEAWRYELQNALFYM